MRQLSDKILSLAKSIGFDYTNYDDYKNVNYVKNGVLDSFQFVSFITLLEEEFNINFTQSDYDDPRFQKISTLETLITEKLKKLK